MKLKVNPHYIEILEEESTNEKEIKISDIDFEFSEEITDDYVKEAYFTNEENETYKIIIEDDKCDFPQEVLQTIGTIEIGVVAFKVDENENEIKRYNPTPITKYIEYGSLKNAENSQPITPSEMEQFEQQLQNGLDELEEAIANIDVDTTYAREMGDYAKEQGDYSKEQGENAQELVESYSDTLTAMQTDISTNTANINTNTSNIASLNTRMGNAETNISTINTNLANYSLITETGSQLTLNLDSTNFKITALLKDKNGNTIYTSNEIDLPVESVVVNGSYDNTTKEVVLTLENGSTIRFSVADLVSGLQSEITSSNKLASDLVDDSNSTNKFVTSAEKTTWNNKSDFSGNYNDLTNKPTIPTQLSSLQDDSTHRLVTDTEKSTWNAKIGNTDYATDSVGGVIKSSSTYGNGMSNGALYPIVYSYDNYQNKNVNTFIGKGTLENVIAGKDLTTKAYVDGLVGDIESILETLDIGAGV